ncbi:hypothetical protein [Psychrobacillus glaciei]|nr:hypothetical protein [Psychrobacillus glaciei]
MAKPKIVIDLKDLISELKKMYVAQGGNLETFEKETLTLKETLRLKEEVQ